MTTIDPKNLVEKKASNLSNDNTFRSLVTKHSPPQTEVKTKAKVNLESYIKVANMMKESRVVKPSTINSARLPDYGELPKTNRTQDSVSIVSSVEKTSNSATSGGYVDMANQGA